MPSFSKTSEERLATCHEDLQVLFNTVIKYYDCTIVCGHRSQDEQYRLFQQGRTAPGEIVTHCDGFNIMSKHNYSPSMAVDVVPYPVTWEKKKMREFGWFVLGVSKMLKEHGAIDHDINWGGTWRPFIDLPHFQIDL